MPISTITSNSLTPTSDLTINGLTVGKSGGNIATNTVVGNGALANNTTATNNTSVGYLSSNLNNTGDNNVSVGAYAGQNNTSGSYHVFLGRGAGLSNTTGTQNVCVGGNAGYGNQTGNYNTYIGARNSATSGCAQFMTGSKNTVLGGFDGNMGGLDIRTASSNIVLSDGDGNPKWYYLSSTNTWTTSGNISYGVANQIANVTYNDNNANEVVGIPYYPCLIKITIAGAAYSYIQWYPNSGAGVAWSGSLLNPGNATWAYGSGPSLSFSTSGTNSTGFTCSIVGGSGAFRIQRLSGSVAYSVAVYRQALE